MLQQRVQSSGEEFGNRTDPIWKLKRKHCSPYAVSKIISCTLSRYHFILMYSRFSDWCNDIRNLERLAIVRGSILGCFLKKKLNISYFQKNHCNILSHTITNLSRSCMLVNHPINPLSIRIKWSFEQVELISFEFVYYTHHFLFNFQVGPI